jgi:RHS repeat-associated protein
VQEKNGATVTANLLTGLGIDEFFTRTDGVGVRALLHDALGSTVALGDGTGTLQTQYTYEPFGVTTQTGSASTNSYKYTAREDDGTGLYYYRARYYHPRLQRFIAEDSIGFLGGDVNLYGYVRQNPILRTDPSGQVLPAMLLGCALGAASGAIGAKKPVQGAIVGGLIGCSLGPLITVLPATPGSALLGGYLGTLSGAATAGAGGGDMRTGAVGGALTGFAAGLVGGPFPAIVGTAICIGIGLASGSGP